MNLLALSLGTNVFICALLVFVIAIGFIKAPWGTTPPNVESVFPPEPMDNIDRQSAYIAKMILLAQSQSECDYIDELIRHYETTFFDAPEIVTEVQDMRDELQMRRNVLSVSKLQKHKNFS